MQRRRFVRALLAGVPVAAGVAAAAALKSGDYVKEASETSLETLRQRIEELKSRFENSDARNRKLVRLALMLAALSLGLDASSLM